MSPDLDALERSWTDARDLQRNSRAYRGLDGDEPDYPLHPKHVLALVARVRAAEAALGEAREALSFITDADYEDIKTAPDDAYDHKAWRGFWFAIVSAYRDRARAWLAQNPPQCDDCKQAPRQAGLLVCAACWQDRSNDERPLMPEETR